MKTVVISAYEEDKNTVVISAFPGSGKTYCSSNSMIQYRGILDSDSSDFSWIKDENGNNTDKRNPDFPTNYMNHIKDNLGKVAVIFVSSHEVVRNALRENNIEYTLIYPDITYKDQWMQRFENRGDNDKFIQFISNNWDDFLNSMDNETYPNKIKLPWESSEFIDTSLMLHLLNRQ